MNQSMDDYRLNEAVQRLVRDSSDLAATARSMAGIELWGLEQAAKDCAASTREAARRMYAGWAERARQRPIASLLSWAGTGFLAGLLLGRR